jgi:hypothetical protein
MNANVARELNLAKTTFLNRKEDGFMGVRVASDRVLLTGNAAIVTHCELF